MWVVPTATLTPRASVRADRNCRCCWRRVSAMSRGRELTLAVRCSSFDSRLPICFSRSSLRSLSSVIKSYMTFCICLERQETTGHCRGICNRKNEILLQITLEIQLLQGSTSTPAVSGLAKDRETVYFLEDLEAQMAQWVFVCVCFCLITKIMYITYKNRLENI